MDVEALISELSFKAVRSSGSGGQHVNKVSSKIELQFNVLASQILTDDQKELLLRNLKARLTKDYVLILQCGESRSQHKNKTIVVNRFLELIKKGLKVPKKRIKTKVPRLVKLKRLSSKKQQAEKKQHRKNPNIDL